MTAAHAVTVASAVAHATCASEPWATCSTDAPAHDVSFRVIARLPGHMECTLLVVTSQKLVLCQVCAQLSSARCMP